MSTTNRVQAFVVAEVIALNVPLPFAGYLKPEADWIDPLTPEYYALAEIDGTSILGHLVNIRKSVDGAFFIYSDSSFSYRLGHFDLLKQMGIDLGISVEILTTVDELNLELSDSAGAYQISTWVDPTGAI